MAQADRDFLRLRDASQPGPADPRRAVTAAASLLAAVTSIGPALIFLFISWYVYGYRCNEKCGVRTGPYAAHGWSHFRTGFEWPLQFWLLAVPTLIALLAYALFLAGARPWRALCSLALSILGFLAWLYFAALTGGAEPPVRLPNISHSGPRWVAMALAAWLAGATVSIVAELISARREAAREGEWLNKTE